jgi:hypothetical protein
MSPWRRFFLWLGKKDLQIAYDLGARSQSAAERERVAFAEGQIAGYRAGLEAVERQIDARTHGLGDFASAEDLERAKRGMLH